MFINTQLFYPYWKKILKKFHVCQMNISMDPLFTVGLLIHNNERSNKNNFLHYLPLKDCTRITFVLYGTVCACADSNTVHVAKSLTTSTARTMEKFLPFSLVITKRKEKKLNNKVRTYNYVKFIFFVSSFFF